ncbi:Protein of unknown function [Gryllus bimaculatus]|nr:Protein of unknown function [Gryllus bimaculatus]
MSFKRALVPRARPTWAPHAAGEVAGSGPDPEAEAAARRRHRLRPEIETRAHGKCPLGPSGPLGAPRRPAPGGRLSRRRRRRGGDGEHDGGGEWPPTVVETAATAPATTATSS